MASDTHCTRRVVALLAVIIRTSCTAALAAVPTVRSRLIAAAVGSAMPRSADLRSLSYLKLKRELYKQGVNNNDTSHCKDKEDLLKLAKHRGITTIMVNTAVEDPAAALIQGSARFHSAPFAGDANCSPWLFCAGGMRGAAVRADVDKNSMENISFIKLKRYMQKQPGISKADVDACLDKEGCLALAAVKGVGGTVDAHGIAQAPPSRAPTIADRSINLRPDMPHLRPDLDPNAGDPDEPEHIKQHNAARALQGALRGFHLRHDNHQFHSLSERAEALGWEPKVWKKVEKELNEVDKAGLLVQEGEQQNMNMLDADGNLNLNWVRPTEVHQTVNLLHHETGRLNPHWYKLKDCDSEDHDYDQKHLAALDQHTAETAVKVKPDLNAWAKIKKNLQDYLVATSVARQHAAEQDAKTAQHFLDKHHILMDKEKKAADALPAGNRDKKDLEGKLGRSKALLKAYGRRAAAKHKLAKAAEDNAASARKYSTAAKPILKWKEKAHARLAYAQAQHRTYRSEVVAASAEVAMIDAEEAEKEADSDKVDVKGSCQVAKKQHAAGEAKKLWVKMKQAHVMQNLMRKLENEAMHQVDAITKQVRAADGIKSEPEGLAFIKAAVSDPENTAPTPLCVSAC